MGLRSLRKEKGFTQGELAQMIHVDQTAISQWERGVTQPRLKNCLQLAKALNRQIEDIYSATDQSA